MTSFTTIAVVATAILFLIVFIKILSTPLKWVWKFLLNALSGLILLFLTNLLGTALNFSLDITWLNAIVSGLLGLPGVLLLLAIKYFF